MRGRESSQRGVNDYIARQKLTTSTTARDISSTALPTATPLSGCTACLFLLRQSAGVRFQIHSPWPAPYPLSPIQHHGHRARLRRSYRSGAPKLPLPARGLLTVAWRAGVKPDVNSHIGGLFSPGLCYRHVDPSLQDRRQCAHLRRRVGRCTLARRGQETHARAGECWEGRRCDRLKPPDPLAMCPDRVAGLACARNESTSCCCCAFEYTAAGSCGGSCGCGGGGCGR